MNKIFYILGWVLHPNPSKTGKKVPQILYVVLTPVVSNVEWTAF